MNWRVGWQVRGSPWETREALAWVLQQLIDYPQVLGIDGTPQDSTSGNSHQKKEQ